jgi:transposase InsO family protein
MHESYPKRFLLYTLLQRHPEWTQTQLAKETGMSLSWVKDWRRRLRPYLDAPFDDVYLILQGHSCARKTPPTRLSLDEIFQIVTLREQLPEQLHRVAGPRTIRSYLQRQVHAEEESYVPPASSTIYHYLRLLQYIVPRHPSHHEPLDPVEPLRHWQIDFKDVSSAEQEPEGKQQHRLEIFNVVDQGSSFWLHAEVRSDFTAETVIEALVHAMQRWGVPRQITLDRDTRFVGSPQGSDFRSALLRFGACLGVQMQVCDPHHPQQNAYVERFHRTLNQECLQFERPTTQMQTQEALSTFEAFYNHERPHQGRALLDRPPADRLTQATPLPPLPTQVDPLAWLRHEPQQVFMRRVDAAGRITLDLKHYYVGKAWRGQVITVHLNAEEAQLVLLAEGQIIKVLPVVSWSTTPLSLATYVQQIQEQARSEHRLRSLQERQQRVRALSSS